MLFIFRNFGTRTAQDALYSNRQSIIVRWRCLYVIDAQDERTVASCPYKTKKSMTVISIITVTKNDPQGLDRTYLSLCSQALNCNQPAPFQWIVIDGGVSRPTRTYHLYSELSAPVTYVSEPDHGIFDAMNKGVRLASGTHVLFLNSGDVFASPRVLDELLTSVSASSPNTIISGSVRCKWKNFAYITDLSPWVCHQTAVTPRNFLQQHPFDISKRVYGDLHFWMQLKSRNLFTIERLDLVVCDFSLGGIGNSPEHLWLRFRERTALSREFGVDPHTFVRFILTLVLMLTWKFFGATAYYRTSRFLGLVSSPFSMLFRR